MRKLKLLSDRKKITLLVMTFFMIQPILSLDYLAIDIFKKIGILAPSTIINIIGTVLLFIISWWLFEENKKKVMVLWGSYALLIAAYTIFHFLISRNIGVMFPVSYAWSAVTEIKYILFLVLPFPLMYVVKKVGFTKEEFNQIILFVAGFIGIMLVVTNLLVTSNGSYGNITYDNIFSWFRGAYDTYAPRELTSIGFFEAANPIGAVLFLLFPLVLKACYDEKSVYSTVVLILQTLAMYVIGTRVAMFGTILLSAGILGAFLLLCLLKKCSWDFIYILKVVLLLCISIGIYPFTPAYKNNEFDYRDEPWVKDNENKKDELLKELEGLDEESYEYALIYLFETQFVYFLTFPREYYEYFYSYKFDPYFWLQIFETPFEQRMNGRQIQQIFSDYKFDDLTYVQKLSGLGYSRLSNGGIVLEQDFQRQYYTLGSFGMIIFTFPYLGLIVAALYQLFKNFKKNFNFEVACVGISACGVVGVAYYSGHVFDEMIASFFVALVFGYLFSVLAGKESKNDEKN